MSPTSAEVRRLLPAAAAPKPEPEGPRGRRGKRGPDVVVNDIDVTLHLTVPFLFGVPARVMEWVLDRAGAGPAKHEARVTVQRSPARAPAPQARKRATPASKTRARPAA